MKRNAEQAFQAPAFQPSKSAMLDPKAYFAQYTQQAYAAAVAPKTGAAAVGVASAAAAAEPEKSEIHKEVMEASAVKCASIVKEKGANFTTTVAIEALNTMGTKSSYKLREELFKQPQVKKLCSRVKELVTRPPSGFSFATVTKAAWCLSRFPDEALGEDKGATLKATANVLMSTPPTTWIADDASKVLWVLAKADNGAVILEHKNLVTKVLTELVRDKGRRVQHLSHEAMVQLCHAIARARRHIKKGDLQTIHSEVCDSEYFDFVAARVEAELDTIDVKLLADLIHTHNEIGLKNEKLFKTICPRIIANDKQLNTKSMGEVIKAYTRFMIPLREEQQGFRTMAIVAKGDFIRPSDKPKREGKKVFEKPIPLYEKTQLHARG